jgi:hypothetical protein
MTEAKSEKQHVAKGAPRRLFASENEAAALTRVNGLSFRNSMTEL